MNIRSALNIGNKILTQNKITSSKLDTELLMSKAINKNREFIILNLDKEINKKNLHNYNKFINERSQGKPIAYILGKKFFWKNEFLVNEKVLIPRPDTEIILEEIIKLTKNKEYLNVLDIGVGSGCLLLSLLAEKKCFKGTGIDISKNCVRLSRINSKNFDLEKRVKFFISDIDNFNLGKYDLIISNPPYIKKLDLNNLDKDVIKYEPKLALDGGLDGLSEIRKFIKKSSELIKKRGKLFLEIAHDQKNGVKKILIENGFYINKTVKDLAENDRCIISTKK